jgi:glycine/D-amino acid oxidase-like deaminating enzyme
VELSAAGSTGHVVIGGGVLGLSAAWRLAERGVDVVVLEKDRIGSGASGIAGGIVRNYYRSAAISEVIRRSVELFEAEPEAFGFRQVGYVAAVPEAQVDDLRAIRDHHARVGYESELVVGAERCREYLTFTWPDWEAEVAALLHERRGGWADAMQTVRHLAARARDAGARIEEGVEVTGFELGADGVEAVLTSDGRVECDVVIAAPGPWAPRLWAQLGRSGEVEVPVNGARERRPLFSYLKAQEGEFVLPGVGLAGSAGHEAPVVHLDQAGPLVSDRDGRTLVDGPWGIYFRMGRTGEGITGGGLPVALDDPALDPYGPDNPAHAAEPSFGEFFTSGLAAAIRRFRGHSDGWRATPAGGVVMHTPDNYPICDRVLPNAYAIVDSGHGFKMLALGRLAADDMLDGGEPLLEPFRLSRFERGETHVASKGPYPWT